MAALEVLAFAGGLLLSMVPMFATMEEKNPDATTFIRIGAGIFADGVNPTSPGQGSIPGLAIFDVNGNMIGNRGRGGHMQSTVLVSIEADPQAAISIPEYLSVSAGDDAICIAYITVTSSDGVPNTWFGDIAQACNVSYYISNHAFSKDSIYSPKCLWLKGRSNFAQNGAMKKGMGIHLPDFSSRNPGNATSDFYLNHSERLCNTKPRFWLYDELTPDDMMPYFSPPIKGVDHHLQPGELVNEPWTTKPPVEDVPEDPVITLYKPRSEIPEKNKVNAMRMNGTLIITPLSHHHAQELCDDEYSMGPDFVSLSDDMYCDMHNKKAYPLCVGRGRDKHACFDFNSTTLRTGSGGHPHRREEELPDKGYHNVVNW